MPPPSKKPIFTSQEYYGVVQSLESSSMEQGKLSLHPKGDTSRRLTADLGIDQRAVSEFVEQVRITSQGEGGAAATTSSAVITPALLEGVVHTEAARAETADVAAMRAPALLGNYHAWKMKTAYPIPGSMLVDDNRRRFLSMYAAEEERALAVERGARERAVEVRLAALDGLEAHRLPTAVEALLEQLQEVVRDKDEAVAANAQTELRTPAGEEDAQLFAWMEAKPPNMLAIEALFREGSVNVGAVHPVSGLSGLMRACKLGLLTVVRLYLSAGADASFATPRGVSCLHVCWERYLAMGKLASESKRRIRYQTTLDILRALLEHGANASAPGGNGMTPLHMAAAYGHEAIAALLLRHGADRAMRDFRGLTPQALAEKEGKGGVARLLANWALIEKSYKDEEWRVEWTAVLKDNAKAARESLESLKGRIAPPGTTGSGSPETQRRAKEALWGRPDDPSNPKRAAALSDTAATLAAQATQEALVAHRTMARTGGSSSSGSGAEVLTKDPRLLALEAIPQAEYDLERDALRAVNLVDDSLGAGEGARLAALRGSRVAGGSGRGEDEAGGMPWGRRPPAKLSAAQQEQLTAVQEEEAGVLAAQRRGEREREAMRANAGLGEGEMLLAKQERGRGGRAGRAGSSSSSSRGLAEPPASDSTVPPGRALNLVVVDEVKAQLASVYGIDGLGGFAPPDLREEMRVMEAAKAASDASAAARLAEVQEEAAIKEEARALLLSGKKQKGMGQWVKNKFGRFNFVRDDETAEDELKRAAREAAEARKQVRTDFEAATRRQRELGGGEKRRVAAMQAVAAVAEVQAEEAAMNEDDLDELQKRREHDYLQKWYMGENRAPPSDGSVVAARRAATAVSLRADAPANLPGYTAMLPLPGPGGELAVLTRRPAGMSVLLRPSRFRTDTRPTLDADMVMAQGLAFDSLVSGTPLLAMPLPPTGEALDAPEEDSEGKSLGGAGSVTGADMRVAAKEMAPETGADLLATQAARSRTLRSLAGRGLTVPLRQAYGQLAANPTAVLPYASAKRIAAESAPLNPAGTSKAAIAAAAQATYAAWAADKGRAGVEAAASRAALAGAPSAAQAAQALEAANVQRVRRVLDVGLRSLAEDMEDARGALADARAHAADQVDYSEHIPAGRVRTVVVEGGAAGALEGGAPSPRRPRRPATEAEAAAVAAGEAARRAAAAAELKQEAAARQARELGLAKAPIPRLGAGALQTWPLHAPGVLPLETSRVGGPAPGSGTGGTAAMLYRHYSVLDAVESSKRLEAGERAAAAEALAARRGLGGEAAAALKAKAGGKGSGSGSGSLAAASRSRAVAIMAMEASKESMSSQAKLFFALGSTRAPAVKDSAVPILSGGALETEDYLARVRVEREYERAAAAAASARAAKAGSSARDRVFDSHKGAADPWAAAHRAIDFDHIAGAHGVL